MTQTTFKIPTIAELHNLTIMDLQQISSFITYLTMHPPIERQVTANDTLAILYSCAIQSAVQSIISLRILMTHITKGEHNALG